MAKVHTEQDVGVDDAQRRLSEGLGSRYRVTVASDSSLKVGRPGVIGSRVTINHANGGTTFSVHTTGLILSRILQAASINPRVKRALAEAYPN